MDFEDGLTSKLGTFVPRTPFMPEKTPYLNQEASASLSYNARPVSTQMQNSFSFFFGKQNRRQQIWNTSAICKIRQPPGLPQPQTNRLERDNAHGCKRWMKGAHNLSSNVQTNSGCLVVPDRLATQRGCQHDEPPLESKGRMAFWQKRKQVRHAPGHP